MAFNFKCVALCRRKGQFLADFSKFRKSGLIRLMSADISKSDISPVDEPLSENDDVNPSFENRNPRNLEKMCLARKPAGWILDYPTREYWHKVILERNTRHTTAKVVHFTGLTVASASTQEWSIRKHLYSASDVSAAHNLGRILAQRCLESGILYLHAHFTNTDRQSEAVSSFITALEKNGLHLEEPTRILPVRDIMETIF